MTKREGIVAQNVAARRAAGIHPRTKYVTVGFTAPDDAAILAALDKINPKPLRGDPVGPQYGRVHFIRAAVLALLADDVDNVKYWLDKSEGGRW